jgi:hypothetical protein
MGRLAKQKRLLMEESNKRLLNEQEIVVGKEYVFTDGNGKQYKGTVGRRYSYGVIVDLSVPEEIANQLEDKPYRDGVISVDLAVTGDELVNNMAFNTVFGGGLKNDEIIKSLN